jgi:hypothetical protein
MPSDGLVLIGDWHAGPTRSRVRQLSGCLTQGQSYAGASVQAVCGLQQVGQRTSLGRSA